MTAGPESLEVRECRMCQHEHECRLADDLRHVVVIDDARFFFDQPQAGVTAERDPQYPPYAWVQEMAEKYDYSCAVNDDLIRLLPQ